MSMTQIINLALNICMSYFLIILPYINQNLCYKYVIILRQYNTDIILLFIVSHYVNSFINYINICEHEYKKIMPCKLLFLFEKKVEPSITLITLLFHILIC